MVNIFHRKIRVNDGFGVSKVVTSMLQTRNVENRKKIQSFVELQVLFDQDDSQHKNNSSAIER